MSILVKNFTLLFLFILAFSPVAFSQHEMTLFHMNNVFQGTYVNPSLIPEQKVSIGLPGISSIYSSTYFSPFVAKDIKVVQTNDSTYKINLDNAISKMEKKNNYLNSSTAIDLLSIRFKARNLYFSLNATNITNIRLNMPQDLFSLAWYGNAQYVGSMVDLKNIGLNAMQYNEYALGIARAKDGGKFTYGIRLKFLQGLNSIYTAKSNGTIAIDNEFYTHTLNGNMQAYSATTFENGNFSGDYVSALTNFNNKGFGADAGITYKPTKKWAITGAVNNLGYISWKTNATSYTIDGSYTFKGINLDSIIKNGQIILNNYVDTLKQELGVKEKKVTHYKTYLTPSIYVSVSYALGKNTKIALTGYSEFYHGLKPAGSVAFIQRAGRVLNFVLSYNVRKNSYNNMGIGILFKPGPIQYYLVGDNMLVLNPFNTNNFSIRTGMNLVFGKTRKPEMQTHKED